MKKSYRVRGRKQYVTVRIPLIAARLLLASQGEEVWCAGGNPSFRHCRSRLLQELVLSHLAYSLSSWLDLLINNYALDDGDDPDGRWPLDDLLPWLSDWPGWGEEEAFRWLGAYADLTRMSGMDLVLDGIKEYTGKEEPD